MAWLQKRGVKLWRWWWYLLRFCSKKLIISLDTVSILWLGSLPSLSPMCATSSLIIFEYMLIRLMNINSLVGGENRLFMESWNFWKASHRFCWRCDFLLAVFFDVSFFTYFFSLLSSYTSLYCATLSALRYIPVLKSGFLVEVSSFTNITFFWFIIVMYYFFISWIGMTVIFLKAS